MPWSPTSPTAISGALGEGGFGHALTICGPAPPSSPSWPLLISAGIILRRGVLDPGDAARIFGPPFGGDGGGGPLILTVCMSTSSRGRGGGGGGSAIGTCGQC